MELQLFFFNENFPDYETAVLNADQTSNSLAAVSFFYEISATNNTAFDSMFTLIGTLESENGINRDDFVHQELFAEKIGLPSLSVFCDPLARVLPAISFTCRARIRSCNHVIKIGKFDKHPLIVHITLSFTTLIIVSYYQSLDFRARGV